MQKITVFMIFLLTLVGCTSTRTTPSQEFGGTPDVFCKVIQKPDPLLMGTWEVRFLRTVGRSRPDDNYVKYRLARYDDKYGLYFYRIWRGGKKKKREWKHWTINGLEIAGEARFGVRIFLQDRQVYFTIRDLDKPVKMTRVED